MFFYEPGCGHCETAIAALKRHYQELTAKGFKIIAIASDVDAEGFKETASTFPWATTYCDLKGFSGVNFMNYGVIGTPTMYVLDSKGIIIQKPATVDELEEWSSK